MTGERSIAIVRSFWRLMASNDFDQVAAILSDDFVLEWPQSKERIRGTDRFAQMNREYPVYGPWRFEIQCIVGGEAGAVSDVIVNDGTQPPAQSRSSPSPTTASAASSSSGRNRMPHRPTARISSNRWLR